MHFYELRVVHLGMPGQVVTVAESPSALVTLKGLLLTAVKADVALEVDLATEATRAETARKGFGCVICQRLQRCIIACLLRSEQWRWKAVLPFVSRTRPRRYGRLVTRRFR